MRKLLAAMLAVLMTAELAATVPVSSYTSPAWSIEWYMADGRLITADGGVDRLLTANRPEYVKDADDPSNDTVLLLGWVQLEDAKVIQGLGYRIDGGEAVYSENFFTRYTDIEGCRMERRDVTEKAGFTNAEGFVIKFGYGDLPDGDHTVSLLVKGDDKEDCAFFTYGFTVYPAGTAEPAFIVGTFIDSQSVDKDIIQLSGWTGANYETAAVGYKIDGGEPVFGDGSVIIVPVPEDDPVKDPETGGGRYAERFSAYIDLSMLGLTYGEHRLAIVIAVDDGKDTVLEIHLKGDGKPGGAISFFYEGGDRENDVWLCKKAGSYSEGWRMQPGDTPEPEVYDICVSYTADRAFYGFAMACRADEEEPAEISVSLLDGDGNVLEEQQITVTGNHHSETLGFVKINFDSVHDAGSYVIRIILDGGRYFVLSSGDHKNASETVSVYGSNSPQTQDSAHGQVEARAPAIRLLGDDDGSGGETEPLSGAEAKDVNCDGEVNNKDVVYLFRYVSDNTAYDALYDVNGDGSVDNKDVVCLFRLLSLPDRI